MATIIVNDWSEFITAVGTSGAEVEFPKNLVRTADTDVDPNKLYVDANGIVQTNVQPEQLPNLYENTFTLDANLDNDLREGLTTSITIACNSINGFGGYIKNLASNTVTILNNTAICDISTIAFLNMYAVNVPVMAIVDGTVFNLCLFSGSIKNETSGTLTAFTASSGQPNYEFISCSSNFELAGTSIDFFYHYSQYGGMLKYCRFELDTTSLIDGALYITPINSYLTGDWSTISVYIAGSSTIAGYASIFEIETAININLNRVPSMILINNELYTGTIPSGFSGVSSADLANAQTLRDTYGFPIQT